MESGIIASEVKFEADRCVKCGLCLAQCPTYRLTQNETCSPRGRIALVQALQKGGLSGDGHVFDLLDSCLVCQRCEAICPSGVNYSRVLDEGKAMLAGRQSLQQRLMLRILTSPRVGPVLMRWGRRMLPVASRRGRLLRLMNGNSGKLPELQAPDGAVQAEVILFGGCSSRMLDGDVLAAAHKLLLSAGVRVRIPRRLVCCGAADAHAGNAQRAAVLQRKNRQLMESLGAVDALLSVASGCGAYWQNYDSLPCPHEDIVAFLNRKRIRRRLCFEPLEAVVAVHTPCTLENALHGADAVLTLLRQVPGLKIYPLGAPGACCGAGGMAFVRYPQMAAKLRTPVLAELRKLKPDYVLSSNAACSLHLQMGVEYDGVEFLHPVVLLARQLKRQSAR